MAQLKSLVWMIVGRGIASGTGYSRRVFFELEILKKEGIDSILVYPDDVTLPKEFSQLCTPVPVKLNLSSYLGGKLSTSFHEIIHEHGKPDIIYGQSLVHTFIASKFAKKNKINLIFDYHGKAPKEKFELGVSKKSPKDIILSVAYKIIEAINIERSNEIVLVSENFRNNLKVKDKAIVLPMVPSEIFIKYKKELVRTSIKSELGISEDSIVFCYLGQAQFYQMAEETVNLYKSIEKKFNKTHLLIITKDPDNFQSITGNHELVNYTIISADHKEVPRYLDISDFGFVLRGPSVLNTVSSPTKVLEYLSMNVVPIMTQYVGDFPAVLPENSKIVLDYHSLILKTNNNVLNPEKVYARYNNKIDISTFVLDYSNKYIESYTKTIKKYIKTTEE
ncbi:hypothetical protein CFK37_08970 [Virgibacillus phasianinus]|uniref:Glycosyltransferase subfamily 4-like N-terminal domain-containing protein n=1 Tax=Virgibacillus phasianinus TaxID=2017483 RepID=A0A220U2S3_9BACI|nr:hypothetical protein [Virgibacillus phasianinus]ASK62282.1 hypothetical protein CFK37_08970 [Virgibacillus phasianinus]